MKTKFDKIIEKLFCKHKWKETYSERVIYKEGIKSQIYILICENCGKIKKVKIDIFS